MKTNTKNLVGIAVFTAIVFIMQYISIAIRFGTFSVTLALVPIIVGAAMYGKLAGLWLGFVFGIAVFVTGDANFFFAINPMGTIITVLVKGALAGLLAGLVYHLFKNKSKGFAVVAAAITSPIVNTGVFIVGCFLFFADAVAEWAGSEGIAKYVILNFVGFNFIFELIINAICCPTIIRLINIGRK